MVRPKEAVKTLVIETKEPEKKASEPKAAPETRQERQERLRLEADARKAREARRYWRKADFSKEFPPLK